MNWTRSDGDWLVNQHRRSITDPDAAIESLGRIADPAAGVWPTDYWPALRLDRGLAIGSSGGHGPVRYHVVERELSRVRFEFDDDSPLDGWHELRITDVAIEHELRLLRPAPWVRLLVIGLHDALIEHLLDNMTLGNGHLRTWPRGSRWRYLVSSIAEQENLPNTGTRRTVAGVLAGISILHGLWAFGSTFPASSRQSLAGSVIGGGHELPPPVACAGVAIMLVGAATAVQLQPHPQAVHVSTGLTPQNLDRVVRVVELTLAGRGLIGLTVVLGGRGTPFRKLNRYVYSPLCLALAAGVHVSRSSRTVERAVV